MFIISKSKKKEKVECAKCRKKKKTVFHTKDTESGERRRFCGNCAATFFAYYLHSTTAKEKDIKKITFCNHTTPKGEQKIQNKIDENSPF